MAHGIIQQQKTNMNRLKAEREACSADGIECGCCPVERNCLKLWDSLIRSVPDSYTSGIPTRFVNMYKDKFAKLQEIKHEEYSHRIMVMGRDYASY